jgi:hypothetical protein
VLAAKSAQEVLVDAAGTKQMEVTPRYVLKQSITNLLLENVKKRYFSCLRIIYFFRLILKPKVQRNYDFFKETQVSEFKLTVKKLSLILLYI